MRLTQAVETGTQRLAKGTVGTIVSVWAPDEAFEVEFAAPVAAVVTVMRDQIAPALPGR